MLCRLNTLEPVQLQKIERGSDGFCMRAFTLAVMGWRIQSLEHSSKAEFGTVIFTRDAVSVLYVVIMSLSTVKGELNVANGHQTYGVKIEISPNECGQICEESIST